MNILLVWPPDNYAKYGTALGKQWLPIGLGKIASYLRKKNKNINVKILCPGLEKISFKNVIKEISSKKLDLIGISYITVQAPYAFTLSKIIRKETSALLVHGGIHPTTSPEECSKHADLCVLHEGEETFVDIVNRLEDKQLNLEKIKGICFKKNKKLIFTPEREFIKNIDETPFPAYDLFPMDNYDDRMHVTNEPMVHIMESRGCPYNCSFCVSPKMWKRITRWHSPKYIIEYMKYIIKNYKIDNFHFHGDNFLLKPDWAEELCKKIIKENLDLKWCALTRAEHVTANKQLLPLMKKSGCIGIEIGIDSAQPEALEALNKGQETNEVIKAFKYQRDAEMTPLFTVMSFNPMETIYGYYKQQREVFKKALNYNVIHPGQTSTPYPGTKLWEEKENFGVVVADNWEEFDHKLIPFIPSSLLKGKPKKVQKKLYLNEQMIILGTYYTCRVDLFNSKKSLIENFFHINRYRKILKIYYSLCNGKFTVREISEFIAHDQIIKEKESLKFIAFATMMSAKLGIIKDINSKKMRKIKVTPFYNGYFEKFKSIIKYIYVGAAFHLFGAQEKIKAPWEKK
jgi:magnesium-protoporphyrin IX monomethyl ester (oxidative) cyclase